MTAARAGSNVAGDPLVDALSAIGGVLKDVAEAVLSSGVAVGSDGVSIGGVGGGGQSQDQFNQEVADSLARDLGESFRSDVIPTLMGNQPGTVQPGSADPDDDDVAQAPAAIRQRSHLTAAALEGLATESTLAALTDHAAAIAANTAILTELPIIESLAEQGVSVEGAQSGLNLGERQTDILALLQSAQSLAGPAPNLAEMPGSGEGNPLFAHITNQKEVQDVRLVGGKIESVGSVGSVGEITKQVSVKQVGTIAVTQSGEWVMRLASGGTIPVYVEGGRIVADIEGGLEGLALSLADEEVGLRAVGAI